MADQVYLASDGISKRNLNQACDALRDAARKLQSASAGMGKYYAVPHIADSWRIFDIGAAGEASKMAQETSRLADRLEEFNDYLPKAQGKLHDVDERYHENVLEKAWNKVKSKNAGWLGLVAGSPAVAIFGALFGAGKQRTGSWVITTAEATEKKVETVDDYRYLLDVFDWSSTTATEEEKIAVITAAIVAAGGRDTESAVRQGLQELYDESYHVIAVDYSEGVRRGRIRYCNQNPTNYQINGWRDEHKGICSGQCNWAVESMAFSYLGIDIPPSSMHDSDTLRKYELALGIPDDDYHHDGYPAEFNLADGNTVNVQVHGKWEFNRSRLDEYVENFSNDNGRGKYSPVMLHYSKGNGMHWILITGKNEDGSYSAIGPWSNNGCDGERIEFHVTIDDYGVVSGDGFSGCHDGRTVDCIGQYSVVS